jgi:hypothetical protein
MELLKTCTYRHSVLVIMEDSVKAIDGCAEDFRHGGARGKGQREGKELHTVTGFFCQHLFVSYDPAGLLT